MTKCLWITDAKRTGYANATRMLLGETSEHFTELHVLLINHTDPPEQMCTYWKQSMPCIHTAHSISIPTNMPLMDTFVKLNPLDQDYYIELMTGLHDLHRVLTKIHATHVISINDNAVLRKQYEIIMQYNKKTCWIPYMPVDCGNFKPRFWAFTKEWANIITMSEYGAKELTHAHVKCGIHVVPHALDTTAFHRMDESKASLRKRFLPQLGGEDFVILNANVNQNRKRLDLSIMSFARFLKETGATNAHLVLKCSPTPSATEGGIHIHQHTKRVAEELELPRLMQQVMIVNKDMPLADLNMLFNVSDVFLSTTSGEGFGMLPCEAALAGIPQIVPANTSYIEIFSAICNTLPVEQVTYAQGRCCSLETPDSIVCVAKCNSLCTTPGVNSKHSPFMHVPSLHIDHANDIENIWMSPEGSAHPGLCCMIGDVKVSHHVKGVSVIKTVLKHTSSTRMQVLCNIGKQGSYMAANLKALAGIDYEGLLPQHITRAVGLLSMQEIVDSFHVTVGIVDPCQVAAELANYYCMHMEERAAIGKLCMQRVHELCCVDAVRSRWVHALLNCICI